MANKYLEEVIEASKQFAYRLIEGYKNSVEPRFHTVDVRGLRDASHNNAKGAASMLKTLGARGLVKREGDGYWSIPSMKALQRALKW